MCKWWPFKSKKKEAPKMVTRISKNTLDNKTFIIKAKTELGFWEQNIYRELLLTPPDKDCASFDIAEMVSEAKADRRSKKFRHQAASILHERRCQWQLYEVEIYNARRVELRYFNYRTENRGTITLDLTRRPWAIIYVNNTESSIRYRLEYVGGDNPVATFNIQELKDDGQSPVTFTFEDGKIWCSYEYRVAKG